MINFMKKRQIDSISNGIRVLHRIAQNHRDNFSLTRIKLESLQRNAAIFENERRSLEETGESEADLKLVVLTLERIKEILTIYLSAPDKDDGSRVENKSTLKAAE